MTAILLTPPGAAAIAVIRVHGEHVPAFLAGHFSAAPRRGRAVYGKLRDGERVIDDPVVALIDERTADINLHGGPWIVRTTLELLSRNGFDILQPAPGAPLPPAAVDADEPIRQEVLAHLPRAKTELGVRMLLAQPAAWAKLLAAPRDAGVIASMLADRTMERMLNPPRIAIVGPANAGKSTLANRLFGAERSITADLPGTTRDWVGHLANLDGLAVMLMDTPGLRPSDDAIEQAAIARAREQVRRADAVIVLLDATRPMDDEQQSAVAQHPGSIVVANKIDAASGEGGTGAASITVSARTGMGIERLVAAVRGRLGCDDLAIDTPRCWTARQRELLGT